MLLDLVQLRLRQHPTIPHYHYSSQAELLPHLVHLVGDRCGISGIAWIDQPLRDHPHHQVALAAMLRRNDGVQPKLANRAQDGFDVPVWKCSLGAEEIVRRNQRLIPKKPPQGFNLVLGPVGEVGQRALAGFLAFPPSFAQQDGRWRIAVGDDFDIHGSYYSYRYLYVKRLIHIYMGTY